MTGPALRRVDSHSSIHEAMLEEARELTDLLSMCISRQELERAAEVAAIIVEHWESRTLQHAQSEEEGLYQEAVQSRPDLRDAVITLTRDHNLMRYLIRDIKDILQRDGATVEVVQRFYALILIDTLHNEDEERMIEQELA